MSAGPTSNGRPAPLGASAGAGGVNFSVYSRHASRVDLLLFDREAIQIEKHLGGVEPHPVGGIPGAVRAIAVDLARLHPGGENVPVVVRAIRDRVEPENALRARVVLPIEEQHLDARRAARVHAEIDAARRHRRAQRRRSSAVAAARPQSAYAFPSSVFAAITTRSGWKPNFFCSSFSGADAPKVFIPIICPFSPT